MTHFKENIYVFVGGTAGTSVTALCPPVSSIGNQYQYACVNADSAIIAGFKVIMYSNMMHSVWYYETMLHCVGYCNTYMFACKNARNHPVGHPCSCFLIIQKNVDQLNALKSI